ncbi:MAG TPA: urea ABC transporter ATP-binding subunit UrtE [Planctomycetota bacterium]|nr:urea ABC transporter ATP-binding subunit UrtE [Planctomycetota bacterium]
MLKVEKLNVYYGESHILRDVDLEVRPGEVICLMGRNGVGKTTLLKTITGRLPSRSGKVSLGERDVTKLPSFRRARLGVGYAPQGREIFGQLTVWENLQIGLDGCRNGDKAVPDEIFELFPVLKQMLKRKGGDLSGGQQQQLAIGRALVSKPTLLLLDEPTEGIQPSIIQEIERAIRRLRERGTVAILLVEQYLDFAQRLADAFAVMEKGEIVKRGPIAELTPEVIKRHLAV